MKKFYSKYLKEEIEISVTSYETERGEVLSIIPHCSLEDTILNVVPRELGVEYDVTVIQVDPKLPYALVRCIIADKAGRTVTEFGEATVLNLTNEISKAIPATMAHIRAFDRAAIRYLAFDSAEKVYSKEEFSTESFSKFRKVQEKDGKPAEEKTSPKGQKASSKAEKPAPAPVPKKAGSRMTDNFQKEESPALAFAEVSDEAIMDVQEEVEDMIPEEVPEVAAPVEEAPVYEEPIEEPVDEPVEEPTEDDGDYVINQWKYESEPITLKELFSDPKNEKWIAWVSKLPDSRIDSDAKRIQRQKVINYKKKHS